MMTLLEDYTILEDLGGHTFSVGKDAGKIKNRVYKVKKDDEELFIMYCEPDSYCFFCPESYKNVLDYEKNKNDSKKITFHKLPNGYVLGNTVHEKGLYVHQIITNCYHNGKGTMKISVDHIDRNPLNNKMSNLRIATREIQQKNSNGQLSGTKRNRNSHAQVLPDGLEQNMIPKHVTYMNNLYNKEKGLVREYFRIENHPNYSKNYDGCKSMKKTIFEKLDEIKRIVNDLDNNILPKSQKALSGLPKYVRLLEKENDKWLIYEKRTPDGRQTIKMRLPNEYTMVNEVDDLLEKVSQKYGE